MADRLLCLSFDRHKLKASLMPFTTHFYKLILLLLVLYNIVPVGGSKTCRLCEQGTCINDSCVCLPGWRNQDDSGKYCNECYGRISLHGTEGIIYDGSGNYSKDNTCSWLLDTGQTGMRVTFQVNKLSTECIWDHLYVHDGDSAFSPLVAAYSGVRVGLQTKPNLKIKLSGRYAYIHFYSDAAYTLPGFNVSYIVDNCDISCSDNGICTKGKCECQRGWTGPNCDSLLDGCPNNCSGHGVCENRVCKCSDGYRGDDCYHEDKHLLLEKMPVAPSSMDGRASFAFTKDDSDVLWIVGGYRMGDNSVDGNLYTYNTVSTVWDIPDESNPGPWPRYGHTAVFFQGALYLYGGIKGTKVMDDFWMYTIATGTWTKLSSGPRDLSGHSAEIVGKRMLIFFGYSSDYGYSNKVLEYDFVNQTWKVLKTMGSVVQGGYGHTSVYDKLRQKIYVYGGYHSPGNTPYNLTDMLYEFEPVRSMWTILHSSGKGHYLHSAAMMNGLMLVFGGNTNNDSRLGRRAECYTSEFLVYDRDCNRWHTQQHLHPSIHFHDLDRFGQRMVSDNNNHVFLFGGFHAWSKSDLWKVSAGSCSAFNETQSCENSMPGVKCMWKNGTGCVEDPQLEKCLNNEDVNFNCSGFNRCEGCLGQDGCQWCSGSCFSVKSNGHKNCTSKTSSCPASVTQNCALYQSCRSCQESSQCVWTVGKCKGYVIDKKSNKTNQKSDCEEKQCSRMDNCLSCTKADCMWCSNLNQCILTKSYVAFYFYGQCQDWTTKEAQCQASNCSTLKTCDDCSSHTRCGWCDDGSGTGTGFCHEGGMGGPVTTSNITSGPFTDFGVCPKAQWFFTDCPKCQCNGHSQCVNDTGICGVCQSHTAGSHCQYCEDGYYGDPLNGGNCSVCACNDQADLCNPMTGDCFCKTRGVIGKKCDRCDEDYKYKKNSPGSGTCFYHLNTDFSYTFNLSKREDSNYTQINFINVPTSSDRDVDFTLNCSTGALINITYTSKSYPMEKEYVTNRACDYFRTKFEHKNHAFGGKENTTFYVYVYDFKTPFKLQISFVQRDKLNLVRFFIIFFSCFLSLLLIAAALWKIKHKYDNYRRRRQLIVEMQQMASRPFSSISVEIDRKSSPAAIDKRDHLDSVLRRRKKAGTKPSEVAIEPLADSKAAILTLIIQLPTGGGDFAPAGQSGLAIGSALVSMGSHRKQSLDHAKGDKPKLRKHLSNVSPDTCA